MTLYVIENDNGEVLDRTYYEFTNDVDRTMVFDEPIAPAEYAKEYGGHVVELVEKPEPVEVSEEEAKTLKTLDGDLMPIGELAYFIHHVEQLSEKESIKREDRLMRAYVIGWTVDKPKRWIVKVPHADGWIFQKYSPESKRKHHNLSKTFPVRDTGLIGRQLELTRFTLAEMEQYDLIRCEHVEVTGDDAKK
ncbi:MAG: DUF1642 domain-containing protein [Lacticaseibacillus songhuajiangensis]|jgi:hypothetical protein|nr:DUF1642 domain-containing protein [Lacticaseibacillus songhuajiangensis]